jgi:hypothetical protein
MGGPCIWIRPQSPHTVPTQAMTHPSTSTISPCQTSLQHQGPAHERCCCIPTLENKGKKYIHEVIGTFLYYAHYVDSTMLPALRSLATQQASPTCNTKKLVHQFLDYTATLWCNHHVLGKRHDPSRTEWRFLTLRRSMHTVGQVDTSLCPTMTGYPPTIVRSSWYLRSPRGHAITGGGRDPSPLHQLQRSCPCLRDT